MSNIEKQYEILYPGMVSRELYKSFDRHKFFQSDYFKEVIYDIIEDKINSDIKPIISCDVFDTVLLRNKKSEPFRFYEIAERIKKELKLKENAYEILMARYLGTEISYGASKIVQGCREGSLYDIHKSMLKAICLDPDLINDTINIELTYEIENLELNVGLWNVLTQLKKEKDIDIILISDTYQHKSHILTLLKEKIKDYDNIVKTLYSSADTTISKHSSKLFDYVADDLSAKPSQFIHMGDNLHSDYLNPKKRGWDAIYLPIPKSLQEDIRNNLIEFKKQLDKDGISIPLIDRLFIQKEV